MLNPTFQRRYLMLLNETMRSMAMVDRSGWDQSFIDVASGGAGPLSPSSTGSSVIGNRVSVGCPTDAENLGDIGVDDVGTKCGLFDFVRGLRINDLRNNANVNEDESLSLTMFSSGVDEIGRRTKKSPSSTAATSGFNFVHCMLPLSLDRFTPNEVTPTNGGLLLPEVFDVASDISNVISSHSPRDHSTSVRITSAGSTGQRSTPSDTLDDAFPTYENTSRTLHQIEGSFLSAGPTSKSISLQTPAETPSPFDSNCSHSFMWTSSDCGSGVPRMARHSSSASDFVGSSTTGSPPPLATPSTFGGIDVCCRSSTSPFRGGSGSQSDSGCSDGGGDSSDHASSAMHFRFSTGPSPIVDDCQSAIAAFGRTRSELAHPAAIRFHTESLSSPPPMATTPTVATSSSSTYSRVVGFLPAWDIERLETVYARLRVCGFYFGKMSIDEAAERLRRSPVGTFLLRDSADERYLFSISVQTCRGTTSIRVAFRSGLFRLDCSADQEHLMPTFDCVLRLIAYYVGLCRSNCSTGSRSSSTSAPPLPPSGGNSYVLLETSGRRDTPVLLRVPLRDRVSPLTHLCRRTVHAALGRGVGSMSGNGQMWLSTGESERSGLVDRLQLIPSLKRYLKDYPYDL